MTKLRSNTGKNQPGTSPLQAALDFEAGLTEKYPRFIDVIRAQIYMCGKPLKTVAADMDMSQSELSRKLGDNPSDPRRFTTDDLEKLIPATGTLTVIHWLVEKHLQDPDERRDRALNQIQKQLPDFLALLKAALPEGKR